MDGVQGLGRQNYAAFIQEIDKKTQSGEITQQEAEDLKAAAEKQMQELLQKDFAALVQNNPEALQPLLNAVNDMNISDTSELSENHGVNKEVLDKFDADASGGLDESEKASVKTAAKLNEAYSNEAVAAKFDMDGNGALDDKEKAAFSAFAAGFAENGILTEEAIDKAIEAVTPKTSPAESAMLETINALNQAVSDLSAQVKELAEKQQTENLAADQGAQNAANTPSVSNPIASQANMQQQIQNMEKKLKAGQSSFNKIDTSRKNIDAAKSNIEKLIKPSAFGSFDDSELNELKGKMDASYAAYTEAMQSKSPELQEAYKTAEDDVNKQQGLIDDKSIAIVEQEDKAAKAQNDLDAAIVKRDGLRGIRDNVKASFDNASAALSEADNLPEDAEGRDDAVQAAQSRYDSAKAAYDKAQADYEKAEQEVKDAQSEKEKQDKELDKLQKEKTELETQMTEKQAALTKAEKDITEGDKNMQQLADKYHDDQKAYEDKKNELINQQQADINTERTNITNTIKSEDMKLFYS